MNWKKLAAHAALVGALGSGAIGLGAGAASADTPLPQRPGFDQDDWGPGGGDHWDNRGDHWDNRGDHWDNGDHWVNRDWWRHQDKWWRDDSPPPWGWRAPPPAYFSGHWDRYGPPPPPINYWGRTVQPYWDDGFHTWGFFLFGIFIPVFGVT